jgi:hypothetical protein
MTENNHQTNFLIDNFNDPPRPPAATPPTTFQLRLKAGQEGHPSSRKVLLWMTAKNGLGEKTPRLGEADQSAARRTKSGRLRPILARPPARSAATIFTLPKSGRHSEERLSRRRISSMLPRPGQHDKSAFDVMARTAQYWMRFFASLRMTAEGGAGGGSSIFGRGSCDGVLQSRHKLMMHRVFKYLWGVIE